MVQTMLHLLVGLFKIIIVLSVITLYDRISDTGSRALLKSLFVLKFSLVETWPPWL